MMCDRANLHCSYISMYASLIGSDVKVANAETQVDLGGKVPEEDDQSSSILAWKFREQRSTWWATAMGP